MIRTITAGIVLFSVLSAASGQPSSNRAAPQTIVLSGGCFWGVEAVYRHVHGVLSATSGYTGGEAATATYPQVGTGRTGHAESVQVVYDPAEISLELLLQIFFSVAHDPTQLNRQGPDYGTDYRSAIWYTTEEQADAVRTHIAQLTAEHAFPRPIVTEVNPLSAFYPAEAYHQNYLAQHLEQPYIVINDLPKLEALQREFPALWRDAP